MFVSGDPDKSCYDGSTSVHVAAACGQFHCLVFLTKFGSNIWSLDNQYHTPLEEAAARGQLDCVQYLDRVVAEQMLHHRSRATKQKKEAEKMARKRIKKVERNQKKRDKEYQKRVKKQNINGGVENESKENIPNHWNNYRKTSSSESGEFENVRRARSLEHFSQVTGMTTRNGSLRSVRTFGSNTQGSVRQTFLGPRRRSASSSSLSGGKTRSLTSFDSANIIFHPRPSTVHQPRQATKDKYLVRTSDGLGNSYTSVESLRKFDSLSSYRSRTSSTTHGTSSRYSWASSQSMDSDLETDNGEDEEIQSSLSDPQMAPLMTFLASLNLEQFTSMMRKESIDMKALSLCTDKDLKSAGIPLGPRRKILEAVERRRKVCAEPGPLIDTHL